MVGTKLDLREGGEEFKKEHPGASFITTVGLALPGVRYFTWTILESSI